MYEINTIIIHAPHSRVDNNIYTRGTNRNMNSKNGVDNICISDAYYIYINTRLTRNSD